MGILESSLHPYFKIPVMRIIKKIIIEVASQGERETDASFAPCVSSGSCAVGVQYLFRKPNIQKRWKVLLSWSLWWPFPHELGLLSADSPSRLYTIRVFVHYSRSVMVCVLLASWAQVTAGAKAWRRKNSMACSRSRKTVSICRWNSGGTWRDGFGERSLGCHVGAGTLSEGSGKPSRGTWAHLHFRKSLWAWKMSI